MAALVASGYEMSDRYFVKIYDGPLLDQLPGSDIEAYCSTMERLLELPVTVVHAGHDPSFGRERLRELALDYLRSRR